MFLSLHILADSLKDVRVDTHILSGEMCIRNASVLFGARHYNPHTVYIASSEDFIPTLPDSVICVNRNDYFVVYGSTIEEVHEQLLDIIDFYQEWDLRIRDRIEEGCPLQEITEEGADILQAMVGIMNSGFIIQAVGGKQYAGHIPDRDLEDLQLQTGLPMPHVNEYSAFLQSHLNEKGPYLFYEPVIRSRFMNRNILINGWLWGFCFVSVESDIIPESKKQLFQVLYDQLRYWWERNGLQADRPEQTHFFMELLKGTSSYTRDQVWEFLNRIGWSEADEKYLCLLREHYGNNLIYLRLIHQISQTFSQCYVLEFKDMVALVINSTHLPIETITTQLPQILQGSEIHIGISYPFQNLMHLPQYLEQAQIALESAFQKNTLVSFCSDSVIPYIRNLIRKTQSVNLEHPVAKQIRRYDAKHGTQYYHTLQIYLMEERSVLRTAEVLRIHKNTLLYRIHRMEELFPLDLDDREERFRLILNYMMYSDYP